jgi:5-methylcytosine-specific restriction enzyme subunit McrC
MASRRLTLTEYCTEVGVALDIGERDSLAALVPELRIAPTRGEEGLYDLTPGPYVGAVSLTDLAVEIRPKLEISRVLFLLSYAMDPSHWHERGFDFEEDRSLYEALIPGFMYQVKRAFERGLLQGYRVEEDALSTVRGRIRFDDQVRYRQGIFPPIEVRFDEFTVDILENRLLKAAILRLRRIPSRSKKMRRLLAAHDQLLADVEDVAFDPRVLPDVSFTRLNDRYRGALQLARLILRNESWDARHGAASASAFLVNMNEVFENFVVAALRESLRVSPLVFPQQAKGRRMRLDIAHHVHLRPDLSWWAGDVCQFVGDVKYKRVNVPGIKHADLYQLLAYAVATDLPGGLLVYAKGEGEPARHVVKHLGRELHVVALDLSCSPSEVLDQIDEVAALIRRLRVRDGRAA